MKWHVRLLVAAGVALALGVISALVLTIVDLYLTGHGQPSIHQADIVVPGISAKLSLSDLLLLASIFLPGFATWLLLGRAEKAEQR